MKPQELLYRLTSDLHELERAYRIQPTDDLLNAIFELQVAVQNCERELQKPEQ
jgi:hypothetical protein